MSEQNQFEINPYATPQAVLPAGDAWVRSGGQSLHKVGLGISLVYYGIVLALLAIIILVLAMVVTNLLESPIVMFAGAIAAVVMLVVAAILNFVGPIICLAVPAETRSKGLITGSVVFQLLNLFVGGFVQVARHVGGAAEPWMIPAQLGSNVIGSIAFILFILFIKRLATFIGRRDLAQRASSVLNTWIALVILLFVGVIILSLGSLGALLILIPVAVIGIIVLLMYVRLIESMKNALTEPQGG